MYSFGGLPVALESSSSHHCRATSSLSVCSSSSNRLEDRCVFCAVTRVTSRSGKRGADGCYILSGFLGGVASVAAGIHATTINYQMGHQLGLYALTAAVLGGIGSVPGAIVGGLVIGLIRAISVTVLGPRWAIASVFLVLIVFLAFRPQGIFGKSKTRRLR